MLDVAHRRGLAVELNTRFLYRDHPEDRKKKYLEANARLVRKAKARGVGIAVGSDAHSPKDQGNAFGLMLKLLDDARINEVVFPRRGTIGAGRTSGNARASRSAGAGAIGSQARPEAASPVTAGPSSDFLSKPKRPRRAAADARRERPVPKSARATRRARRNARSCPRRQARARRVAAPSRPHLRPRRRLRESLNRPPCRRRKRRARSRRQSRPRASRGRHRRGKPARRRNPAVNRWPVKK